VDTGGDNVFSRAGLPGYQDGGVGGGDFEQLAEHAAHGRALSHDVGEQLAGVDFAEEVGNLVEDVAETGKLVLAVPRGEGTDCAAERRMLLSLGDERLKRFEDDSGDEQRDAERDEHDGETPDGEQYLRVFHGPERI